jgi:hypothetical protein
MENDLNTTPVIGPSVELSSSFQANYKLATINNHTLQNNAMFFLSQT